jgi:hypothetical protein
MKSNRIVFIVVFALAAVAAVWFIQPSEDVPDNSPTGEAMSSPQSGMIVNIDPATGKPMETIPTNSVVPDATSSSTKDLVVVPSQTPGGGEMIDLQGRFQNSAVVSIADSDSVTIECVPKDDAKATAGAQNGGN